jgi:hypothetical protein
MDHDERVLAERRQALEEAFFAKQNEKLKARMRAAREREEAHTDLHAAFPHAPKELLERFIDQGLDVEAVSALGLVPAVMVAWANGRVGDRARDAVLNAARTAGLAPGSRPYTLLAGWLSERPSSTLIELWTQYVAVVCEGLEPAERVRVRDRVLQLARAVAEATGGLFGIHRVSEAETALLRRIEQAFPC